MEVEEMKLIIQEIKKVPRWKFWKIDRDYITVECNDKIKHFSLYDITTSSTFLFIHYCKNKCLGLNQFARTVDDDWTTVNNELGQLFQDKYNVPIRKLIGVELNI